MTDIALQDYIVEIETLIEGNAYDEAIAHCRHILGRYPKYLDAYRLLGKAALEKEDDAAAIDIFQRVLSIDPEDFVARVGLSIVYDRQDRLDDALWQMERGFELMPSNDVIQSELRRLYGRRDGAPPDRVGLTRGALARMYAQGDLYGEAIAELRALLKESPSRLDLQVLLAEALWRDDQRNEAASAAEGVLAKLPYCLTANLILGEIWRNSGFAEDGEMHLRRAQELDPDNSRAVAMFAAASPLAEQTATINRLEYRSTAASAVEPVADQVPEWLAGLAGVGLAEPESATLAGLPEPQPGPAIEAAPDEGGELPDWLTGTMPEAAAPEPAAAPAEETPDWMSSLWGQTQAPAETEAAAEAEPEATPDWLTQLQTTAEPEQPSEQEPATPDWLSQLGLTEEPAATAAEAPAADWLSEAAAPEQEATPAEEEQPDWLSRIQQPAQPVTTPEAELPLPSWLSDLETAPAATEESPADIEKGDLPDWLQALRPQVPEKPETPVELPEVEESEVPEWLAEVKASAEPDQALAFLEQLGSSVTIEPPRPVETPPSKPAEAPPVPEGMPSADEALAFLQSLAAGKEDMLREQAEREGESRMETIMGGKPGTSPLRPPPETKPPEPPPPVETPPSKPAEAPPAPEGMPSADEALAFLQSLTAGKEDMLREQAEREAESRMETIMGGKPGTSPLRPPSQMKPLEPPRPVETPPEPGPTPSPHAEIPPAIEELIVAEDSTAFLHDLAAEEEAPPAVTEPVMQPEPPPVEPPAAIAQAEPATPVEATEDYWLQTAEDEGGEPLDPDYFTSQARPPLVEPKAESAPRPPAARAKPATRPLEPAPIPAPVFEPVGAEEFQARLKANPEDHEARLNLARVWWASAERDRSLKLYQELIEADQFLPEVAADLQRNLETFEQSDWFRALGDAYMKLGNLAHALDAYRGALANL